MNSDQKQILISQVKSRYKIIGTHLSEKEKRIWAASEAITIGHTRNVRKFDRIRKVNVELGLYVPNLLTFRAFGRGLRE